jgi:apolipoprotein N-acyltransferase
MLSIFAAIIAGVLMAFAHPFRYRDFVIHPSWWMIMIATLGILIFIPAALRSQKKKMRFGCGFVGGLVFYSIVIYWIAYALHEYGNIHISISILAMLLLAAYCALFTGIWSVIAGTETIKDRSPLSKIILWASLWTSLEALRQWLFTGFGWGELGYAFSFDPDISRLASVWGAHGFTFLWIFLAGVLLHARLIGSEQFKLKPLIGCGVSFLFVAAAAIYFYPQSNDFELRVALIQPDISQEMKWDPAKAQNHLDHLMDLTTASLIDKPHLILWPETALPYSLSSLQKEIPFHTTAPILFGAVVREGMTNRNSAVLAESDSIVQRFDKIHLVPFGEFVPFKEWVSFGKLVQNAGDFLPGNVDQPLLALSNSKTVIGPLICYEDIFTRSSVAHARRGANLLANLTNDAWYGPTSAQAQHSAMAAMQVYQTSLPMIRATNNGLSAFITPYTREDLTSFTHDFAVRPILLANHPAQTFLVWSYPLIEWIFPIIFVIALLWKNSSRTKRIFFPKRNRY